MALKASSFSPVSKRAAMAWINSISLFLLWLLRVLLPLVFSSVLRPPLAIVACPLLFP